MKPVKKFNKPKNPVVKKLEPKETIKNSKFSFVDKTLVLKNKNTNIIFVQAPAINSKKGLDANILKEIKDVKSKMSFIEKMLQDSKYDFAKDLVFLTKEELDNFVSFSKLFKKKISRKEFTNISINGSPVIIEILKELAVHTNKKNVRQNLSFFNNFLDIYNVFKRFKKDKEPNSEMFSLMYTAASKGKKEIDNLKKKIVLD